MLVLIRFKSYIILETAESLFSHSIVITIIVDSLDNNCAVFFMDVDYGRMDGKYFRQCC